VRIFDVAGRLMAQPFAGKRAAGTWTTQWDARDAKGRSVSTGVYLVQLHMGGQTLVRRVVLTR
jgi:flagellar hook assembly protein FlgD